MFQRLSIASVVLAGSVIAAASGSASGGMTMVPVAIDASVNIANPDGNLGNFTHEGGLFAGLDETGSDYRFYLKFLLPQFHAPIEHATLRGFYSGNLNYLSTFVGARFVPDDSWTELGITNNNSPASEGDVVDGENFFGEPGRNFDWDITSVVQSEAAGDGVLSLMVATVDGRFGDMKFFASREFNQDKAFHIIVHTADVAPIPLPLAVWAGLGVMGLLVAVHPRVKVRTPRT